MTSAQCVKTQIESDRTDVPADKLLSRTGQRFVPGVRFTRPIVVAIGTKIFSETDKADDGWRDKNLHGQCRNSLGIVPGQGVKAKTEELLYVLMWTCEMMARPTFRNLNMSFEEWAYRNGLQRQLATLERQQFLESKMDVASGRLHRLTDAGRLLALGGRDPEFCWRRHWDGKWRMVVFDVPESKASWRTRLRRNLAGRGFGYLQNSVWITPHRLDRESEFLSGAPADVASLILLEARPCAGESDADIVRAAWSFHAINERYERHAQILMSRPERRLTDETSARVWHEWLSTERLAWQDAMKLDPLLPRRLHPPGYRGMKAWSNRLKVMTDVGERVRRFRSSK